MKQKHMDVISKNSSALPLNGMEEFLYVGTHRTCTWHFVGANCVRPRILVK